MSTNDDCIPPHIAGMYIRACQKQDRAHKNWRRCFFVVKNYRNGRDWCFTRNARLARRYKMWDRLTGKYQHALQVIVPYLGDLEPTDIVKEIA